MNIIGLIPVRMASSRFPGKPLARIRNIPMVAHVYFRSKMNRFLDEVYITSCDEEILSYAESIGAKAIMTRDTHERASERVAEAMIKIESATKKKLDIVVMIQGDEPMIFPEMIDLAIKPMFKNGGIQVVNLMTPLKNLVEFDNPNEIKVVVDENNFALYFSREPIPSRKKGVKKVPMLKQVCIIPFRRDFLLKFIKLKPSPLESIESIDMLRILENGYKVKMVLSNYETYSVDTIDDLRRVEKLLQNDSLVNLYKETLFISD